MGKVLITCFRRGVSISLDVVEKRKKSLDPARN
jgi:hypothetical protein